MGYINKRKKIIFATASIVVMICMTFFMNKEFFITVKNIRNSDASTEGRRHLDVLTESPSIEKSNLSQRIASVSPPESLASSVSKLAVTTHLQGAMNLAEAFRISIVSPIPSEASAAVRVRTFCMAYQRKPGQSFDDWLVDNNVPLDKMGAPPDLVSTLELERKSFARIIDERCSGFTDGAVSSDEAWRLVKQAFKNPLLSEFGRTSTYLMEHKASSLDISNSSFGSNDPLAYSILSRAAKKEIDITPTTNDLANNLANEYVAAIALCANNIDCSSTSITFAENCMALGACKGVSADDALREALRGHNVSTVNLDPLGYALSQWLAGKGTWAQLIAPFTRKS